MNLNHLIFLACLFTFCSTFRITRMLLNRLGDYWPSYHSSNPNPNPPITPLTLTLTLLSLL